MVVNALGCSACGAGLPPPDAEGNSACMYCGSEHRAPASEVVVASSRYPMTPERPSWHDFGEDAARIPMTEDAVLDLLRLHFADVEAISVCPHIPPKKEHAARLAHGSRLPPRERVLALYGTLLGDGHEGFVVTAKRICWKNQGEAPASMTWTELTPENVDVDGERLFIGDLVMSIAEDDVLTSAANAFHVLAASAAPPRESTYARPLAHDTEPRAFPCVGPLASASAHGNLEATPPPPHTTSYFAYASHAQAQAPEFACWQCRTPLYETTPECAFCGSKPSVTGWLRAG